MATKYIVNNVTGQTINGDITINGNVTITGTTNTRPYKVYTALLTQSGGDSLEEISSGELEIGVTYQINQPKGENPKIGDFTNVGAPNNNNGTYFVATGTTPNQWGDTLLTYNTGAPVVTVLENTIGNIWFTYEGIANYVMNSNGLLPNYKTWGIADSVRDTDGINQAVYIDVNNQGPNILYIRTQGGDFNGDSLLSNTPIEIRVYE
jgi:hypothetical protein